MIAGGAKSKLEQFNLHLGLPSVITGRGHAIAFATETQPISIPFESPWGPLCVSVGFTEQEELVGANC